MHSKITKLFSVLLCLCMLAFSACAAPEPAPAPQEQTPAPTGEPSPAPAESTAFTPGAYQAEVNAYHGAMVVEVTVSETAITDVQVVSHGETYGIGSVAVDTMPGRIVAANSLAVDTMTGCTISSASILAAAKNALTDAGFDVSSLTEPLEQKDEDKQLSADVVVVGGGLAGLAAALGAVDEGASVILLEKAAMTGGATATSGGEMLAAGTSVQAAEGIEDTAQALVNYWLEKGEGGVDEEMVTYVGLTSPKTIDWMIELGAKLSMDTPTSMPWQDPKRCHKTAEGVASTTGTGGGVGFTIPMTEAAIEKGVEILYETPATSLMMDGGAIIGVEAQTRHGGKVTITAKNVILATGGFDGNDEMMKAHMPLVLGRSNVGRLHDGDGHRMAEQAGAQMLYHPSCVVTLGMDYGATGLAMADIFGKYLYVLPNGERFMDESEYWFMRSGNMIKNDTSSYWIVVGANTDIQNLDAAVEGGTAMKGETLEELAQNTGMDAATLKVTVERYDELCAKGKDEDFGKDDENLKKLNMEGTTLNPVGEGPYYAINCALVSVSGTLGGPEINLDGQVINTAGEVISGLYAAGEMANAQFYNIYYPCSGSSLQYCATMGRRAGAHAAK
ncbi:FAD-dependent oxidoreductase [Christensenellaceae bacterium OttesenSCG-928-M15]|nr:FAD-dependent oxidoreductase [Christensenellaceae bacterium OttesenSCG-928-M15]